MSDTYRRDGWQGVGGGCVAVRLRVVYHGRGWPLAWGVGKVSTGTSRQKPIVR